jgi:ribosome recycling factor
MYKEIITLHKEELKGVIEHFEGETAKIRTGRANPGIVENIMVDCYGTATPIKQIANISVPEARQLLVQPWDRSNLQAIEKAIIIADVGANVSNDGIATRLSFPPMTEENRKSLVKVLNQKAEEARVGVRTVREDAWKDIQKQEKSGEITEDEKFIGKDELQEVIDAYNKTIEEIRKKKEQEIMTI